MIGTTVGKYRIVDQLGRGGTGIVYKAVDETLGREVAIKILNPDLADTDVLKRFQIEATALAKLNHRGIATIYEMFRSETDLLMVMELVRGETLEKLATREGPMAIERAVYLVDQLLSALGHAHQAGVVHRDIKPANVMVTSDGGIKVMDFGIARVRDAEHTTSRGHLVGTPAYMSPEQVLGEIIDERSDLYSAGVVLYRLLAGALPFESDTSIGMLQRQIAEPPVPLRAHCEGLPDWCQSIVDRALAKSPADRFQTAQDFRTALEHASGIVTTVDAAKSFTAAPVDRTPDSAATPKPHTVALPQRRRATWVASTFAAFVIGLIVIGYTGFPRRAPAPAPSAPPVAPSPARTAAAVAAAPETSPPATPPATKSGEAASVVSAPSAKSSKAEAAADSVERFPVLVFDTKALVPEGGKQLELDAQLVLAGGRVTVTALEEEAPIYAVPYSRVRSISYSQGRAPLWKSPRGPEPAVKTGSGLLRKLGIGSGRHWIALRTGVKSFIVLRVRDTQVEGVLTALEKRTGRRAETVDAKKN